MQVPPRDNDACSDDLELQIIDDTPHQTKFPISWSNYFAYA